jgi:hypothetical protein
LELSFLKKYASDETVLFLPRTKTKTIRFLSGVLKAFTEEQQQARSKPISLNNLQAAPTTKKIAQHLSVDLCKNPSAW